MLLKERKEALCIVLWWCRMDEYENGTGGRGGRLAGEKGV